MSIAFNVCVGIRYNHTVAQDSPEDLRERRVYLETFLIEVLWNQLSPSKRLAANTEALRRRIQAVKETKAAGGDSEWTLLEGQPLDENDDIVQAFLGPGTWTLYLPEVLTEQLTSLPLTDENVPAIEQALHIDTSAMLQTRRANHRPWWSPSPLGA